MDPEATLKNAQAALDDDNAADAAEYLQAYTHWRRRRGFEPVNGDQRARDMREHLLQLIALQEGSADDTLVTARQVCELLTHVQRLHLTYYSEHGGDGYEFKQPTRARASEGAERYVLITSVARECSVPLTADEYVLVGLYDTDGGFIASREGLTLRHLTPEFLSTFGNGAE